MIQLGVSNRARSSPFGNALRIGIEDERMVIEVLAALLRFTLALCFLASYEARAATQKEIVAELRAKDIDPVELVVTMERTMCFGSCPSYRVTITGTGHVEYEGLNCVTTKGLKQGRVSADKVLEIANALIRAHFFDASSEYVSLDEIQSYDGQLKLISAYTSDGQTTYLQFKLGTHEKRVQLYSDYPADFKAITDLIDQTVDIEQWIGTYCERQRMPLACLGPTAPECKSEPVPLRQKNNVDSGRSASGRNAPNGGMSMRLLLSTEGAFHGHPSKKNEAVEQG
jgi:hypothetical protein